MNLYLKSLLKIHRFDNGPKSNGELKTKAVEGVCVLWCSLMFLVESSTSNTHT